MIKLKPVQIGPVTIAEPVILAPMSGITDLPFRRLVRRFGVGLVVSEMIASREMVRNTRRSLEMTAMDADEHPAAVQIAGVEPEMMAEAAKIAAGRGAALIDINMGCPAKKVVNGQAGSALMRDERLAAQIMAAVVGAVSLPVTLKIRLGWDDASRNAPEIARVAESCGIKAITVHGRTRNQFFKGRAEWRPIGEVKEATSLPVIGNGDIGTIKDARELLEQSGADGLMIGRAVRGRPWLPAAIMHALKFGCVPAPPPFAQQGALVHEHVGAMMSHYGTENGLRAARKHLGWFCEGLPGGEAFRARVVRLDDSKTVFDEIDRYYGTLAEQAAA